VALLLEESLEAFLIGDPQIGDPQRLTTCFTHLSEGIQRLLMLRHRARGSASHLLSPAGVSFLFLGLSPFFSFQLTPVFKPSFPFSQKNKHQRGRALYTQQRAH
jgi:hypothetical protein